jgi:hypothetical protein
MRRPGSLLLVTLCVVAGSALATESRSAAQGQAQPPGRPEVLPAVHADHSRPLRDIPPRQDVGPRREIPVGHLPPRFRPRTVQDPVTQSATVTGLAVTNQAGFVGVGESLSGFNVQYAPPDINGAAGTNDYVQWVNTSFAVFDKTTGGVLYGPAAGNTVWSGFGGGCQNNNDGDPIVQYDKLANRWIMTQFSVSTKPYLQCVAVSATDDPTGIWYRYAFQYSYFPDYPKLGVWPDGYYMSFNMFNGNTFEGSDVCAYDRNAMLAGQPASQVCFQFGNTVGGLLPSDLDGLAPPPAGAPNAFVGFDTNVLNLYRFHVDWSDPGRSTLTGPISVTGVAPFVPACNGSGGTCVPQPGTSQQLDTLGDRLMYRLAYRNLGDHESLVVNHAVTAPDGRTAVRWYEIRAVGTSPAVYQQGTYAPNDGLHRWMGSAAQDHVGNIALGFSVSSSSVYPSIAVAGHDQGADSLNTLSVSSNLKPGSGSQSYFPFGLSRWGDYSSMSIDPTDDCTFWYTNEYLTENGGFNWSTWINKFTFDSCAATGPAQDFTVAATPASQTVTAGSGTTYTVTVGPVGGFTGTVSLSVSGAPSGVSTSFTSSNVVTGGSGQATLNVTTSSNTTPGTYTLHITGTSGSLSHSADVTLVVNPASTGSGDFTISVSPGSRNVKAGQSASYTVAIGATGGFTGDVTLSVSGTGGASFSVNPVTGGSGSSTLTINTASVAKGTYSVTITGTSGSLAHSATVSLRVR